MTQDPPKRQKIHRVQIDFTERGYAKLLKLQERAGAATITALIQDALRAKSQLLDSAYMAAQDEPEEK